jgi:hypothetical protein
LNVKKIIIALFIMSAIIPFFAQAKTGKQRQQASAVETKASPKADANKPTISCAYDGRDVTVKITGDLMPLKANIDQPLNDLMLCMVDERTGWSAKSALVLNFCRKYSPDPKHEYVFGPMTAFNRSNELFALRFYWKDNERLVNDVSRVTASGVCVNHPKVNMFIISQARLLARGQARSR